MRCKVENCEKQVRSLGLCQAHYSKERRRAAASRAVPIQNDTSSAEVESLREELESLRAYVEEIDSRFSAIESEIEERKQYM